MTAPETGFLDRDVVVGGTRYPYVAYVPRGFDRRAALPVILFLHGSGERGTDGVRATQIGAGAAIRANPERVPAIVVFPQAPPGSRWLDEPNDAAMLALDRTLAEFGGDPRRVYLTGLSMGGYGALHLVLAHPERFAALAVVCGGLLPHRTTTAVRQSPLTVHAADPYAFTAHALRALPIWLFHGEKDAVIPVDESRRLAAALRDAGADVRYTEYARTGHNSWDAAYGDEELWRWLFAQRRA
ncbi:MAG: prolyl oligopeptidase family serine peptidase [Acidobacteria bacterium]|nr:prolyl oligopeptidase family serine peptidase [Acidobacteriota bacterium]MBV9477916.1 prolyl oligopeptidase family serine peptidase [Acidobacteriota bacterium]